MSNWRIIDECPVHKNIAPYIAIVLEDANAHANSIYRGSDAEFLLNKYGKHSQRQLYNLFIDGEGAPANRPGFSTHELKSDGVAYPHVPAGSDLPWWGQGFDVDDWLVDGCKATAKKHGWKLFQPYNSGVEFHHLNFEFQPPRSRVGSKMWWRIQKVRRRLPQK